jgi:hypothetical protein
VSAGLRGFRGHGGLSFEESEVQVLVEAQIVGEIVNIRGIVESNGRWVFGEAKDLRGNFVQLRRKKDAALSHGSLQAVLERGNKSVRRRPLRGVDVARLGENQVLSS